MPRDGGQCHAPRPCRSACVHTRGARLVHVSTDFVFDGRRIRKPTPRMRLPAPLGVYGASKWRGEQAEWRPVVAIMPSCAPAGSMRQAGRNFVADDAAPDAGAGCGARRE